MYSRALPTDTPSLIFSEGRGRLYIGYLERIIPDNPKYYLSDANHQTDNSSHTNNPSSENGLFCYNECRAPALSWAFACPLLLFHKDYF